MEPVGASWRPVGASGGQLEASENQWEASRRTVRDSSVAQKRPRGPKRGPGEPQKRPRGGPEEAQNRPRRPRGDPDETQSTPKHTHATHEPKRLDNQDALQTSLSRSRGSAAPRRCSAAAPLRSSSAPVEAIVELSCDEREKCSKRARGTLAMIFELGLTRDTHEAEKNIVGLRRCCWKRVTPCQNAGPSPKPDEDDQKRSKSMAKTI